MNPSGKADPNLLVVLGATGDLMQRKILPALFHLFTEGKLAENFIVLGTAVPGGGDDAAFRKEAAKCTGTSGNDAFLQRFFYQPLGQAGPEDYKALAGRITALEKDHKLPGNRIFYLALPPQAFPPTIQRLGRGRP